MSASVSFPDNYFNIPGDSTDTTSNDPAPSEGARPFVCRNYAGAVLTNLNELRKSGRFCDVDLIAGGTKIKAHRAVLSASCAYFDAMFSAGLEESQRRHVSMPSVPPEILSMIIDFIYTGEIVIDKATVQLLIIAADMLQLHELLTGCGEFLRSELHPSNAIGIFRFAEAHNCRELAAQALDHAQAHWSSVATGDELLDLPAPQLINMLSSEYLRVDSEAQVLEAALRWLEHEPAARRRHCFEVLSQVRLPLLSPQTLEDAICGVRDPSIAIALKNVRFDMKIRRGALVSLCAEPRARARRVLLVVGGSSHSEERSHASSLDDNILATALKFDLHKREWSKVTPMKIARIQPGVATLGSLMFVVGGEQGSQILANGEVYDTQCDSWSYIAPMNEARCEFGLTSWNGLLYAFGGWVGSDMGTTIEIYDPSTDTWTSRGYLPEPRFGMGVVSYEGLIYMVGGCTNESRYTYDLMCYDPNSRMWRVMASMNRARSQAAAVVLDGHLYVIGGNAPRRTLLNSVERYSFDKDTWEEVGGLRWARAGCAAGAAEGVVVVAGGDSEGSGDGDFYRARATLASVEVYDPREDAWVEGPAMPYSCTEAGAAII